MSLSRKFIPLSLILIGLTVAWTAQAQDLRVPLYRLYNSTTRDHFYTANILERDVAISRFGYRSEGTAGFLFQSSSNGRTALYRLYHPVLREHFYTTSANERDRAISLIGYRLENTVGFLSSAADSEFTPLYRLYHSGLQVHFYTPNPTERDRAIKILGFSDEGQPGWIGNIQTQSTLQIFLIDVNNVNAYGETVGCGDSAVAQTIYVPPTITPLRESMNQLLALKDQRVGPAKLYNSLYQSNLSVANINLDALGKATIQLEGQVQLGGVCDIPRFKSQIELTARQFSTVSSVEIFINGQAIDDVLSLK